MPPKKSSQKKAPLAPAAHPIRHTRVTRASQAASRAASQAASRAPAQTNDSQQSELIPLSVQAVSRATSQFLSRTNDSQQTDLSLPPPGQRAPRVFQTTSQAPPQDTDGQQAEISPPSPSAQGVPAVFKNTPKATYLVLTQTISTQQTGPSLPQPPGQQVSHASEATSQASDQVLSHTVNSQQTGISPPPPGQQVPRVSQAIPQLPSQTDSSQQAEPSPPPPGQSAVKPKSRYPTKRGRKRSPDDEPSESSGSNTARKRSKLDPVSSQIPTRKPRGRPRKSPTVSQISPPSQESELPAGIKGKGKTKRPLTSSSSDLQNSGKNPADIKGKGKANRPLTSSSSDLQNSGRIPAERKGKGKSKEPLTRSSSEDRRVFRPVQDLPSNMSPNAVADPRSDENASTTDEAYRAALKAAKYPEHFEIFDQVRRHLTLLMPDEAEEALLSVKDPENALFIAKEHELDEDVTCWLKRIAQIDRAYETVRRAHRAMLWTSVLEIITDVEELLEAWQPNRSPPQNQYAGKIELPEQWLMWKAEALVWLGDVHTARGIYPLLTPDSDFIDRRNRSRVEGLIQFSDRDYTEAIEYLHQAVDGAGDYFGEQSDQLEQELRKLLIRAHVLREFEEKLSFHMDELNNEGAAEPMHLDPALKLMREQSEQPMRLIELPLRLWLRENLCKLYSKSLRAATDPVVFQDMVPIRKEVREINVMTGFRFNRRHQVPAAYRPRVIAAYLYLARSEKAYSRSELARHNYKLVAKLHQERWGELGSINYDDLSEEIQMGCLLQDRDGPLLSPEPSEAPEPPVSPELPAPSRHASHPPTPNFSKLSPRLAGDRLPTFYDYKRYYATLGLGPHVEWLELHDQYMKIRASSGHSVYFLERVKEAYDVLSDLSKRKDYDKHCETQLPPSYVVI